MPYKSKQKTEEEWELLIKNTGNYVALIKKKKKS